MNSQTTLRRAIGAAAALAMLAATGCSMTHAQRKAKAEAHWGQVRAKVKLQMARQQFERGFVEEAQTLIDEALSWDRENAEAYLLLARCQLEGGKLSAAERAINLAVQYDATDNPGIAATQGLIAERRGNYEEAISHYRRARQLDDTVVDYIVSEAECLVTVGRAQDAQALLYKHMADYDNDPSLHALLGEIALREGDKQAAEQSFRAVLAAGEYDPVIAEEFAILAVSEGQYHDALSVLEPLVNKQGEQNVPPSVLRATAECMLAQHRTEPAKRALHAVLDRDRDDVKAWFLLARCGIASNDSSTTRDAASNIRRLAPQDPQSLIIDAYACIQEGRLTSAETALRSALEIDDRDALALCMLGMIAERANDLAAARRHYHEALRVDPECAWAKAALRRLEANEDNDDPARKRDGVTDSGDGASAMAAASGVNATNEGEPR